MSARPHTADLAVVLGNEVLKNGKPSARLQARLDCAVSLYRRHIAAHIMVSGGVGKSGFDEATVMAKYLASEGIPPQDIFTDSAGVNTAATAINAGQLAHVMHFSGIIIVTQYCHIPRCMLAFRRAGVSALSADYPHYYEMGDLYGIVREGFALPYYFIKMADKH